VTDLSRRRRSRELFAEGFFLTQENIAWFDAQYLGSRGALKRDPLVSPLLGELSGLPPAVVVTAGFDPLRDEGEEYAHALAAAGTPVVLRRFPGMVHGFVSMTGISRAAREALVEIAASTRALLESERASAPAAMEGSL
jgi:acetyl esterase